MHRLFLCHKHSRIFEECTGAKAAVQYTKDVDAALFVVSTLLSPFGMAWLPITMVIEKLLDRSCQKDVKASPDGRFSFWTFAELFEDNREASLGFWEKSKRAATPKNAVKFVQDLLLGPIYNVCRLLGKLGTFVVRTRVCAEPRHHPFVEPFQPSIPLAPPTLPFLSPLPSCLASEPWSIMHAAGYPSIHVSVLAPPIFSSPLLLSPIQQGIKQFDKAAKAMRPYMKASRTKEEKYDNWCQRQSKFRRYVSR